MNTLLKISVIPEGADFVPNFYRKCTLPDGFICDVLQNDVDSWNPANPILINTPPGSGKTNLVYKVLLTKVIESGKNLLLVSNRTGLSDQEKYAVMDALNDPRNQLLTPAGVRAQEDFGPVRVVTYHRLPALVNDPTLGPWICNLGFIVFDEAHFFVADATFNSTCDYLLKLATSRFCHAIRIYLTGTAEDIMEPLAKAEEKNFHHHRFTSPPPTYREFIWYHRPGTYNQYHLSFFKNLDELIPLIKETPVNKWLVFVDSKQRGQKFSDKLGSNTAVYLDAERKGSKTWHTIVKDGSLPTQVLVTTSVLDNGLNIMDKAVKNVAIIADNRTELLQMIGRRRLSAGEQINLFLCDLSNETISKRFHQCERWLQYYQRYDNNKSPKLRSNMAEDLWREGDPQLLNLFRLNGGILYPNELARHNILRRRFLYSRILNGETSFRREVLSWMHLAPEDDPVEISPMELEEFYQAHGTHSLSDGEKEELRALIVSAYEKSGTSSLRKGRTATLSCSSLNRFLSEMNQNFEIINSDKGWRFVKLPDSSS